MNAIIGFTNMALRDRNDPEKVQENLQKVQLSGNMLLALINDILDMSRIESGKAELHEQKDVMTNAFTSFIPAMESLAASKDIDLQFTVRDIRDQFIFVDGPRFDRILVNIISNAFEEDRRKSYAAGMSGHIAKPINIRELFAELAKFM